MKIGISVRNLKEGHDKRGIGNYIKNLISSLSEKGILVVEFEKVSELKDVDLVHYPSLDFFKPTLPFFKKFPTVVTIHDVIPLLFPQHYPPGFRGKINLLKQKISLKNLSCIITDSYSSKKDIENKLGIKEEKVFPIYLAPSSEFKKINNKKSLDRVSKKYNLPEEFVIYYGDINWNKNLYGIARSCEATKINLVMIGNNFTTKVLNHPELVPYKKFLNRFQESPFIHLKGFMPVEDLVCTINIAKISILASFYEGFGLPIVESQACGTPVITSPISAMKEIGGEGVLYVDPYNNSSIEEGIRKLLDDSKFVKGLVQKGFENVKRFSWSRCAEETIEVYKYALGD